MCYYLGLARSIEALEGVRAKSCGEFTEDQIAQWQANARRKHRIAVLSQIASFFATSAAVPRSSGSLVS